MQRVCIDAVILDLSMQHVADLGSILNSFLNIAVLGVVLVGGIWDSILLPDSCNCFY